MCRGKVKNEGEPLEQTRAWKCGAPERARAWKWGSPELSVLKMRLDGTLAAANPGALLNALRSAGCGKLAMGGDEWLEIKEILKIMVSRMAKNVIWWCSGAECSLWGSTTMKFAWSKGLLSGGLLRKLGSQRVTPAEVILDFYSVFPVLLDVQ